MAAVTAVHETRHAFDGVAASYDRSNTANPLLAAMRRRVRSTCEDIVPRGSHLLDLGCGPGTDVTYFAARGFEVTGIDSSPAMVAEAARQIEARGLSAQARARVMDIERVDTLDALPQEFDAAYSNFGPLNCVTDLGSAARAIARRVRPGGFLIASVIGRVCPWELALYIARGDPRRALIRFARGPVAVPLEGRTVWTQYYTPQACAAAFVRAGFTSVSCRGLAVLTPPPYLSAFADRHHRLVAALQRCEDTVASWPLIRSCGDHFLLVMRRR
jgi:SAM-dependent methyltransferase